MNMGIEGGSFVDNLFCIGIWDSKFFGGLYMLVLMEFKVIFSCNGPTPPTTILSSSGLTPLVALTLVLFLG